MPHNLPDLQNSADSRGIALERVGVSDVMFPITIKQKDGKLQSMPAKIKLFVGLPKEYKGANMSRFMECLVDFEDYIAPMLAEQEMEGSSISYHSMPLLLELLKERLESEDAYARFEFDYFIEKKAPVTERSAPMSYRCALTGIKKDGDYRYILEVNVIAASLCPCSREMSLLKNLGKLIMEADTAVVIGDNGPPMLVGKELPSVVGMGAHNQRSQIRVELVPKEDTVVWIEDIVALAEAQASVATYPILKRPDEKYVTEAGYNNPKFCEDIARDLQIALEADSRIIEWSIRVTNEESIHPYNVQTYQKSANWHP